MKTKSASHKRKVLDCRLLRHAVSAPFLSVLALGSVFLFLYADTITSNFSEYSSQFDSYDPSRLFHTRRTERLLGTGSMQVPSYTAEDELEDVSIETRNTLSPPINVTRRERITWFKKKMPEVDMLNSNNLTERFHGRVLEFLNNNCSVQFFTIWNSPARSFKIRNFLAMDSLFSSNPKACLIIMSRTLDSRPGYRILKPLLDRGLRVLAVTPDLSFLVKNTPAEVWYGQLTGGRQDPGVYIVQNLVNLIRLAVLYKYGGVYLDTDFVVLRDFSGLRNSIGAQFLKGRAKDQMSSAAMVFDIKHPLVHMFLAEYASAYNGMRWAHNGPHLVTRVVQRAEAAPDRFNFTVLPPEAFYPVDWTSMGKLFSKPETEEDLTWVEEQLFKLNSRNTYGIHLWDRLTGQLKIEPGSAMGRLISSHCIVCENIYS